ncbi:hypothetical protein ERJ75_001620000 [Trypanosoma vivax]|nr:hypothetical protein ERJ75_001620000 [Trypanosoma vivax]
MAFLTKGKLFFAGEGNVLANASRTIADSEWNVFMRALRAFVKNNGRKSFSFDHRPPAGPGVAPADGFLRLENGELLLCFESQHAKFIDFEVRWFLLNRLRVAISPAHSKLQRNAFKMSGARWRRADPRSSSNAKRRGRKSTKNANTRKRILPLRMVKQRPEARDLPNGRSNSTDARAHQKVSRTPVERLRLRMGF